MPRYFVHTPPDVEKESIFPDYISQRLKARIGGREVLALQIRFHSGLGEPYIIVPGYIKSFRQQMPEISEYPVSEIEPVKSEEEKLRIIFEINKYRPELFQGEVIFWEPEPEG